MEKERNIYNKGRKLYSSFLITMFSLSASACTQVRVIGDANTVTVNDPVRLETSAGASTARHVEMLNSKDQGDKEEKDDKE